MRGNMACSRWDSVGSSRHGAGLHRYLEWLSSRREFRDVWRVGLDPGNGSTCLTAPLAFESAGCDLEVVNSHPDPLFKGRGSEPNESSLSSLSELVKSKGLDVGFAYDGDGDRFAVVDEHGRFLKQDLALAFVASEMVKGGKKDIVVNVDTSSVVDFMVEAAGGGSTGLLLAMSMFLRPSSTLGGHSAGRLAGHGSSLRSPSAPMESSPRLSSFRCLRSRTSVHPRFAKESQPSTRSGGLCHARASKRKR